MAVGGLFVAALVGAVVMLFRAGGTGSGTDLLAAGVLGVSAGLLWWAMLATARPSRHHAPGGGEVHDPPRPVAVADPPGGPHGPRRGAPVGSIPEQRPATGTQEADPLPADGPGRSHRGHAADVGRPADA
jgi:hypothetical protein